MAWSEEIKVLIGLFPVVGEGGWWELLLVSLTLAWNGGVKEGDGGSDGQITI